jgi:hypothetical protein
MNILYRHMTKTKMLLAAIALLTMAASLGGMVPAGMVIILDLITDHTGQVLVAIIMPMAQFILAGTIRALTQYEYTT